MSEYDTYDHELRKAKISGISIILFLLVIFLLGMGISDAKPPNINRRTAVVIEAYRALSKDCMDGTSKNKIGGVYYGDWNYIASSQAAYEEVRDSLRGWSSNWTKDGKKPRVGCGCNCEYCNATGHGFYTNIEGYGFAAGVGRGGQCKYFAHLILCRAYGETNIPSYDSMQNNSASISKVKPGDVIFYHHKNADGVWVNHTAIAVRVSRNADGTLKDLTVVESNFSDPHKYPIGFVYNSKAGVSNEAISTRTMLYDANGVSGAKNYRVWKTSYYDEEFDPSPPDVLSSALQYLKYQQDENDGFWSFNGYQSVGVTALAIAAFANHGDTDDIAVQKALQWMVEQQHWYGQGAFQVEGFSGYNLPNYDTSLAVLALVAAAPNKYYDNIKWAVDYLLHSQNTEDRGYDTSNPYYGGWGYSGLSDAFWWGDWADLSNTQWTLLALHYAEQINPNDTIVPQAVWNRALVFLKRCQNRQASNPDYSFSNDGGFIYQPGSPTWNGGNSYGSMTTAGLWGYYVTGLSKGEPEVAAAVGWLAGNYSVSGNPGMGGPGIWGNETTFLYYYLYGLAKACALHNVTTIAGHDWYSGMADFLADSQADDGSWDCGDECGPIVNTAFGILALETKQVAQNTGLEITVHSPVDLHVYDAQGRHVGVNYDTGEIDLEIPGATYTGPNSEPQTIYIPNPGAGQYRIRLVATGTGNYSLEVKGIVNGDTTTTYTCAGTVTEGETVDVPAVVSAIAGPITVDVSTPIIDITELLTITHSRRTLYDRRHRCFFAQITVENPGDALSGPIRMVITDPSIPVKTGVGVGLEPDGYTEEGDPYFVIVPDGESLGAGEVLDHMRVNFNLQRKRLTYGIKVEQLTTGILQ